MTSLNFQSLSRFSASTNDIMALPRPFLVERVTRIELAWPAWKTNPKRPWLGDFLAYKGKD
jgi:hypothetical protein